MTHAIVTERLTKYYGARCVVNCLNLRVPAGTVYGFLGRNGAGKSTTIKMLLGMVQPNYGRVELLGHEVAELAARGARPHRLSGGGASALRLDDGRRGRAVRPLRFMPTAGISGCSIRFSTTSRSRSRAKLRRLSNGQRANVALALAIAPDPDLLILDDPTLGLDTVARRDFLMSMIHLVQRQGRTILFSSHILADVERVADRIGILVDGVLARRLSHRALQAKREQAGARVPGPAAGVSRLCGAGPGVGSGPPSRARHRQLRTGPAPGDRIAFAPGLGRRGTEPRRRLRRLHPRAQAVVARFR